MDSRLARECRLAQFRRFAAMSPAERVALAMRLTEDGLASYMATRRVDRATAVAEIKATRRIGRRASLSDRGDAHP
jgi:hypothetical protein